MPVTRPIPTFAQRLAAIAKERKMSQAQLAEHIGVGTASVYRWTKGRPVTPAAQQLIRKRLPELGEVVWPKFKRAVPGNGVGGLPGSGAAQRRKKRPTTKLRRAQRTVPRSAPHDELSETLAQLAVVRTTLTQNLRTEVSRIRAELEQLEEEIATIDTKLTKSVSTALQTAMVQRTAALTQQLREV